MSRFAVLFPGQGSQYAGMGKALCKEYKAAREIFEEANGVLGFDLKKICIDGGLAELSKMENLFPALLTFSWAIFRVYMEEIGIKPHFAAGHSLGEYSALVCSGVLDYSDALRIVYRRAVWAREILNSQQVAMTIINGTSVDVVEEICRKISDKEEVVSISCFNAPDQLAISGHREAVVKVEDELMKMRDRNRLLQVTPLLTSPPFHCPLMQPAADQLKSELEEYTFKPSRNVVISNVTARPYVAPEVVIDHLTAQLMRPVKWKETMDFLHQQGVDLVVEMGPQSVLANLAKTNKKNLEVASFGQKDDRKKVRHLFQAAGKRYHSSSVPTILTLCLAAAVCTRNRNQNDHQYQKGVVEPFENIEKIQDELDKNEILPTMKQSNQALKMLHSVFKNKKVPAAEQVSRLERIFAGTGTTHLFAGTNDNSWEKNLAGF